MADENEDVKQEALDYYKKVSEELYKRETLLNDLLIELKQLEVKLEEASLKKLPRVFQATILYERELICEKAKSASATLNDKLKIARVDAQRAKDRLNDSVEELRNLGVTIPPEV